MKNKTLLLILSLTMLGSACKKDAARSVRYAVTCDSCAVVYLSPSNILLYDTAVYYWKMDFTSEQGRSVSVRASSLKPEQWVHTSVSVFGGVVFDAGAYDTTAVAIAAGELP